MFELFIIGLIGFGIYSAIKSSKEKKNNNKSDRKTSTSNGTNFSFNKNEYSFHTKVVGVTAGQRQSVIKNNIMRGASLTLRRDRYNTYDSNAIGVYYSGNQIGFIKRELAAKMAPEMDAGRTDYKCVVSSITGGGSYNVGVNIEITATSKYKQPTYSSHSHNYYTCSDEFADCSNFNENDLYDCDADPDIVCGYNH